MIAKIVPRPKQGSSFGVLARYVVNANGQGDPATWERTVDYILDTGNASEKVSLVRVSNCYSDDAADAALEILNTQTRNTRSKKDKTMHLVISFPPGEQPVAATLARIEDDLCAALGMADHQRISAVHVDTQHMHIHVAINTVHPRSFHNVNPWYGEHRLMDACERLETQYGLTRTNHGIDARRARQNRYREERHHDQLNPIELSERDKRILRESYAQALAEETEATTLNGVRTLSGCSVVRFAGDGEVLLPSHESDHVEHGGAQSTAGVRRSGDGDGTTGGGARQSDGGSVGEGSALNLGARAESMETHAGRESFEGWIKRTAASGISEASKHAKDWQQFHQTLAGFDLTIRRRGAGLAIVTIDGTAGVKATTIARSLSLSRLTSRWGAFQEPHAASNDGPKHPVEERYTRAPRHSTPDTSALFAEYKRAREAAQRGRAVALSSLRAKQEKYRIDLAEWYVRRRAAIKLDITLLGPAKRLAYAQLSQARMADRAQRNAIAKAQRAASVSAHPLPTWQTYVLRAAERGDPTALAALHSREQKAAQFHRDWIAATEDERAARLVIARFKPHAQKNGEILYRTNDGARVVDTKNSVLVDKTTEEAVRTALTLASQRFADQALKVKGSDAFKAALIHVSIEGGMQIRFADVQMEQVRRAGMAAKDAASRVAEPSASTPTPHSSESPPRSHPDVGHGARKRSDCQSKPAPPSSVASPAQRSFIAKRNLFAASMKDISYNHRLWDTRDAGPSLYQGRRKLEDGSEVLLLLQGKTMLVKPASNAQVAKASRWRVGDTVQTDERGRFVTNRGPRR